MDERLRYRMADLIDEYFPKGNEQRGKAIVMVARFLIEEKECSHPGCRSHVSHPCEVCGRQWGKFDFSAGDLGGAMDVLLKERSENPFPNKYCMDKQKAYNTAIAALKTMLWVDKCIKAPLETGWKNISVYETMAKFNEFKKEV